MQEVREMDMERYREEYEDELDREEAEYLRREE